MAPGRRIVKPFKFTASTIIGNNPSGLGAIRVHGLLLAETGGSSSVTLKLYVPTANANAGPLAPSASGVQIAQVVVGAGVSPSQTFPALDDGILFEDGLYIAVSGSGTLLACAFVS